MSEARFESKEQLHSSDVAKTKPTSGESSFIVRRKNDSDSKLNASIAKHNGTMSIKATKNTYPHCNDQTLSNMMKYDTTVVMSEK